MTGIKFVLFSIWNRFMTPKSSVVTNRIFFHNIWGKYCDNTRALAEAYHRIHPEWEIVYELGNNENTDFIPGYIRTTKSGTKECFNLFYTSRIVVDNDWGAIKKSGIGLKGVLICWLYSRAISSSTVYVSTGHGTPLKKIGNDAIKEHADSFITSTRLMFVLDEHSSSVYERITMGQINNIIVTGSPRNDVLFDDLHKSRVRHMLGLDNKKLFLYAPTFRTKIIDGKVVFLGFQESINDLISSSLAIKNVLHSKFGGEWVIGIRVHPGISNEIDNITNDIVFNASHFPDMADYLCVSDFLLTDYSSCLFDYMLTKKPCVLLWPDELEYSSSERGLYFNEKDLPYPVVRDFSKLINCIDNIDVNEMSEAINNFTHAYGFSFEHHSSNKIIDYIDNNLM